MPIWPFFPVISETLNLADEPDKGFASFFKKKHSLSRLLVLEQSFVSTDELHVSNLTLACVPKHAVRLKLVHVSVSFPLISCEKQDNWM